MHPYCIAVCAATDPTNGAGLGSDILTIQSLGAYPLSVVTAVTIQDTVGVQSIFPLEAEIVTGQWQTLIADIPPKAVKVGMVGNASILNALRKELGKLEQNIPIVIDPVLASGRGDRLADEKSRHLYRFIDLLQPVVVLTPNYEEFFKIMQASPESRVENLVTEFMGSRQAPSWLLLKGGHAPTEKIVHTLWGKTGEHFSVVCDRLGGEYHGSGCTLASAFTVCLAKGYPIKEALQLAQDYTWKSLKSALCLGLGQAIPNRMIESKNDV